MTILFILAVYIAGLFLFWSFVLVAAATAYVTRRVVVAVERKRGGNR